MTQAALAPALSDDDTPNADATADRFLPVPRAAALPTGTMLAARYRLEELIADSRPSVTWRAFDEVLSRSVLVHVLGPGDPDERELLAAARRASVATDSRFLRVLDAVQGDEYPTTQGFVAAGLGVALVPALALGMLHDQVVARPVRGSQPTRRVCAAVRRARAQDVVVQAALTALRQAAARRTRSAAA